MLGGPENQSLPHPRNAQYERTREKQILISQARAKTQFLSVMRFKRIALHLLLSAPIIVVLAVVGTLCLLAGCATDNKPPDKGLTPAAARVLHPMDYLDDSWNRKQEEGRLNQFQRKW